MRNEGAPHPPKSRESAQLGGRRLLAFWSTRPFRPAFPAARIALRITATSMASWTMAPATGDSRRPRRIPSRPLTAEAGVDALARDPQRPVRHAHRHRDNRQVVGQEHAIGRLGGDAAPVRGQGDSHRRGAERRRVVHAVADHRHLVAFGHHRLDRGDLAVRKQVARASATPSSRAICSTRSLRSPESSTVRVTPIVLRSTKNFASPGRKRVGEYDCPTYLPSTVTAASVSVGSGAGRSSIAAAAAGANSRVHRGDPIETRCPVHEPARAAPRFLVGVGDCGECVRPRASAARTTECAIGCPTRARRRRRARGHRRRQCPPPGGLSCTSG